MADAPGRPAAGPLQRPSAIVLDAGDNVAVALRALGTHEAVTVAGASLTTREPIGRGHKLALRTIARGADVVKYHEVIGIASADIAPGEHVHVHNVLSARLPAPER